LDVRLDRVIFIRPVDPFERTGVIASSRADSVNGLNNASTAPACATC
jgi:hypothetical protein